MSGQTARATALLPAGLAAAEHTEEVWSTLPPDVAMIILGLLVLAALTGWHYYRQRGSAALGIPLIVSALAGASLALVVTAYALAEAKEARKQEAGNALEAVRDVTHAALREWFDSQRHRLNHAVNRTDLNADLRIRHTLSLKASEAILLRLKHQIVETTGFLLLDRDARVLAASEPTLLGRTVDFKPVRRLIDRAYREGSALIPPMALPKDRMGHLRHYYLLQAVYDPATGRPVTLMAMRMDPAPIFNIVRQGRIGKSGETYLVNSLAQMISRSRFERDLKESGILPFNETSYLNITITHDGRPTRAAADALAHRKGTDTDGYPDYRGVPVLGAWAWDPVLGFAIVVEIDRAEAMAAYHGLRQSIFAVVLGIVGLAGILVLFIILYARHNERRIQELTRRLKAAEERAETLHAALRQRDRERQIHHPSKEST